MNARRAIKLVSTTEELNTVTNLTERAAVMPDAFEELVHRPMTDIAEFWPENRVGALRSRDLYVGFDLTTMTELFGPLPPSDAYYLAEQIWGSDVGLRTRYGDTASRRLVSSFIANAAVVPAFFTNAGKDRLLRTDAIPLLLDAMDGVIATVDESPRDEIIRPGWIELCLGEDSVDCREIRFPSYPDAGHMVTLRAGPQLAEDLEQWLSSLGPTADMKR